MPKDPIFRTILLCLAATVVCGAILALAGDHYFMDEGVKNVGVGIVLVSGACYLFFRILGAKQAKKEAAQEAEARARSLSSGSPRDPDKDNGPKD